MTRTAIVAFAVVIGTSACSAAGDTEPVTTNPTSTTAATTSTVPAITAPEAPSTTIQMSSTTQSSPASTSSSTTTTTRPARAVVELEIRSRASWDARPPDLDLTPHAIETITIHHTARPHDDTPMEEKLQRWQNYHQSIGFGDIAYHMVIAADGAIYEGRDYQFVGATRTSYDPSGHFLPTLDGMFDEYWDNPNDDDDQPDGADDLSPQQLTALVDLLAWASVQFGVDPSEFTGHRDHAATACPGSIVQDMIESGQIEQLVRDRLSDVDIEVLYVTD